MPLKKIFNRRTILISIPFMVALVVLFCVRFSVNHPDSVEKYYSGGIYPFIAMAVSSISGVVPFSLYDMMWLLAIILVFTGLTLVIFRTISLKLFLLRLAQTAVIIYSLFYLLWGFNYFRPSIDRRLGWQKPGSNEAAFRMVLDTLILNANKTFTKISLPEYSEIDGLLENSYRENGIKIGIMSSFGTRRPKTIFLSSWFAKTGISGYFGPFFNEVHVNSYQLPVDYPFVLAHEKAHQFGFANEAEANLAAFVICTGSDDRRLRYSGYTHILLYFLSDARQFIDYDEIIKKVDKPVLQDLFFRQQYYDKLRNERLEKVQTAANDAFLKSNHIGQGVKNYNQVVGLTVGWLYYSGLMGIAAPEFAQTVKN